MLKKGLLIAVLFLLPVFPIQADPIYSSPDTDTSFGHLPAKLLDDLPHLFIDQNIIPFAVGSVATALDWTTLDGQNALAQDFKSWHAQPIVNFGNFYGEGWVEGGTALSCWGIGALTDDLRVQEFGRDAAESLIDATVLVTALKYSVGRERPDGSNNQSFPSGHSITAFCFAPVVMKYWGVQAGIEAYALGTVTAFARVEGYHHYLSDVLAGATLGILIGNAVVYSPKDVSVSVGPGQVNLNLAFN